ncbi:MAG: efflux RND transporter permease subunit [Caulobacteraceae bacterium]
MCVLFLRPHEEHGRATGWRKVLGDAGHAFSHNFDRLSHWYSNVTHRLVVRPGIVLGVYAVLLGLTVWALTATPTGFIPDQDQGNILAAVQLPAGASLQRTDAVLAQVVQASLKTPGVRAASAYAGVDATSQVTQSNSAQIYLILQPYEMRLPLGLTADKIAENLRKQMVAIPGADIKIIPTAAGARHRQRRRPER